MHRFLPSFSIVRLVLGGTACALAFTFAACSSSGTSGGVGGVPQNDAGDSGVAPGEDSGEGDAGNEGPPAIAAPTACPTAQYKTIVIVGDSISDTGAGGGPDEQPYYRTLLVTNDDAKYPDWKGYDLKTCWSLNPTTGVVKASEDGALATVPSPNSPTDMRVLLNQVTSLPKTLPGPVLVVGTIGGNDVQSGLVDVLFGTPQQVQARIDKFVGGYGAAMTELTKASRFGAGVKVDVLMTDVFDPSGGNGHFYYEPKKKDCPGALGLWPDGRETKPHLKQWNDALAAETAKHPSVKLLELRAPYELHAVSTPTGINWFSPDCIHPNSAGHHALRSIFWKGMVALP